MKRIKLIIGGLLAIALLCSTKSNTFAFEEKLTSAEITAAVDPSYGTEKAGTWNNDAFNTLYRITLSQPGIVSVSATKARSNSLGQLSMNFYIHDAQGNEMLMYRDERKDAQAMWSIGLDKGVYYIHFAPQYSSFATEAPFKYQLDFFATPYAEKEKNDSGQTATLMELDTEYTGYFGNGFSNINNNKDKEDDYKIFLTKGNTYRLTVSNEHNIAGVWDNISVSGFPEYDVNKDFVAPRTGWYYPGIYNYGNDQYEYKIKVSTIKINVPAPTLKSLKAKAKGMEVTWSKKSCDGYEIMIATNSKFTKNKKVVTISKAATTKKKIKSLKSDKTYSVKVRAYIKMNGKKIYSKWSKVKKVKVK